MRKTCERPGCAETATVVFGMVPEDLLVWMAAIDPRDPAAARAGLLCTRHADATVVPIGWSLDDRREQEPRLFRVPVRPSAPNRPGDATARLRRPRPEDWAMALFDEVPTEAPAEESVVQEPVVQEPVVQEPIVQEPIVEEPVVEETVAEEPVVDADVVEETVAEEPVVDADVVEEDPPTPWRPQFDRSDDLGGLLQAQSPLLRRAFGVDD